MGKKKQGKGKEKKLARMQELAREKMRKETIDRANFGEDGVSPRNVMADFAPFAQYSKAGLEASIDFTTGSTMSAETMTFVMDLARENMKRMYDDSGWDGGWKENDKKAEASQEEARFVAIACNLRRIFSCYLIAFLQVLDCEDRGA
jgi:hypothetical protein